MDRDRRPAVVAGVGVAAVVVLGVSAASVLWLHDDEPVGSLWVLGTALGVGAFLLVAGRSISPRRRVLAAVVIGLALVPWAVAVHAALPHDWLAEAEADLRALDVDGLEYKGREEVVEECTDWLDDVQYASIQRAYRLVELDAEEAVRNRVDAHFASLGYDVGSPGSGQRGPLAYTWERPAGNLLVHVEVRVERCGWFD